MANKLTRQGILELLENGEISEFDISDDEEDNIAVDREDDFLGEELDGLLEQFDGNFDYFMDTNDTNAVDSFETDETLVVDTVPLIAPPRNEFPITPNKNIKWLQQPFQCPNIVLEDIETLDQVDFSRNPIDFFLEYFEYDFFETIAFNTNLYAVQKCLTNFKHTINKKYKHLSQFI
uniref:PiggyBac transposable element-derived protein domain-containing protein n=1 Tax=Sipha flava TaxID=143950 RepID=A0A2S2PVD5_9HEMI